jgi:hypothetical protein
MTHRTQLVTPWCLALSLILVGTSDGFVVPQQQGRSVLAPTTNDVPVRGVIFISRPDLGLQMKLPSYTDGPEQTRKHDM